jgi:predicted transcriptional regulator/ribosomal protein S18 acetylase RimI-like enzyme
MKTKTEKLDFRHNLRAVRFGCSDIEPSIEELKVFRSIIEECDGKYPGIDNWFDKKVVKGLEHRERGGILLYHHDKPIGASIVRRGDEPKLCSLRIKPGVRESGFGTLLMALSILEMRSLGNIHFTIPASLWESKIGFFQRYGFEYIEKAKIQYRKYDDELYCRGSFEDAWREVIRQLPELLEIISVNENLGRADLIISIKPSFAQKITSGEKTVELRKRFSEKWEGSNILLYASKPEQGIVGEAKISKIVKRSPLDVWYEFRESLGCDWDTFFTYCGDWKEVSALILSDIKSYEIPIPLSLINKVNPSDYKVTAPQSHSKIEDDYFYPIAVLYESLVKFGEY